MVDLSSEELATLKGQGFLLMKDKTKFVCRIVYPAGIASAEDLRNTAELAEKYASGKVVMTVRLNAEIVGIDYENIEPMMRDMDRMGLIYGGTGARVRPIVACKGTVCKFGMIDTQKLCIELHEKFYALPLPHKFKINITGCNNNCAKAQLNDLAFMGAPKGLLRVFIGGRFGRQCIIGEEICKIPMENAVELCTVCTNFYKAHGRPKQRFGDLLQELNGTEAYQNFISELKSFEV
ncbi:hypothetical protein V6615_13245 [Oscillospiraceae bacterium PP1C4]